MKILLNRKKHNKKKKKKIKKPMAMVNTAVLGKKESNKKTKKEGKEITCDTLIAVTVSKFNDQQRSPRAISNKARLIMTPECAIIKKRVEPQRTSMVTRINFNEVFEYNDHN